VISSSRQVFIEAPIGEVWELIADPERQTEWWPDTEVFECQGERLEQGCKVRNVNSRPWPMGNLETTLEVSTFDPGREIVIQCLDTGTYTRSLLTAAQGGTFVECEAGNDPKNLGLRIMDATIGRSLFRRWVEHALEKVKAVAEAGKASVRETGPRAS
jgi:uncharacterized protein YndB with AHSA1/START domain